MNLLSAGATAQNRAFLNNAIARVNNVIRCEIADLTTTNEYQPAILE